MKRLAIIAICLFTTVFGMAQSGEYTEAMKTGLEAMKQAKSPDDWQQVSNQFDRIASAEPSKWEPMYYAAYSYIIQSFMIKKDENKDQLLDAADKYLEKAQVLVPEESELEVLQAFCYQARISVNPMGRGREYSEKAYNALGKAKALNPDNPRIYFLTGQNLFNTPKFYGGGAEKAKPQFELAKTKFESFAPKSAFAPNWGKEMNAQLLEKCN
jgi:tetratricopeptide (TPR) repeat protein